MDDETIRYFDVLEPALHKHRKSLSFQYFEKIKSLDYDADLFVSKEVLLIMKLVAKLTS